MWQELSREYNTITKLGHDLVHHEAKKATCTESGHYAYDTCTRCSYTTYSEIANSGHQGDVKQVPHIEATCSSEGCTDWVIYCTVCGEEYHTEHTPVSKLSHTPDAECTENLVNANCYNEGGYDTVIYCMVCGEELSRVHSTIPVTHTEASAVKENEVEPTYGYNGSGVDGGYDEVVYCSICNSLISKTHIVTKITADEYYSKYDYLELSSTVNSLDNLIDNNDGTYTLNAKTNNGKTIRLLIDGEISKVNGIWGILDENTKIYTLDALPGVNYIDYEFTSGVNNFMVGAYYSLKQKTSVQSFDELFSGFGSFLLDFFKKNKAELSLYPDYLCFNMLNTSVEIVNMKIYYCDVMSEVKDIKINSRLYSYKASQSYLPGDLYDAKIEEVGLDYAFPLRILIDNDECLRGNNTEYNTLMPITTDVIFGDIIDVNGQAVDKANRYLQSGDTIEVTIGGCSVNIELCNESFSSDKVYDTNTIGLVKSLGTQNVLVIPVTFSDQQDRVSDEWLQTLKGILGNVMDDDGSVTEYKLTNGNISLSDFMSTSSYGKFTTNSYITEPYVINKTGAESYNEYLTKALVTDISNWVNGLSIDRSKFDQNNDGYFDMVILANTLLITDSSNGSYLQAGLSGGFYSTYSSDLSNAGTHESPMINACINISSLLIYGTTNSSLENASSTTIIHEFGHALGLEDYYDNGMYHNTIGKFDMEADNKGDWNSYSKYLLGWIDPITIDGTKDSVEITISSYATYGDAIVIHALGYNNNGTPFDEYIIIDLFAHDGLYEKDASSYNLDKSVGVRIYHVNSIYDLFIDSSVDSKYLVPKAWPHYNVTSDSKYASQGKYLLEMIQKGNVNTFMGTNYVDTFVDADDLFYAGDIFTVDAYDNFFYNGKMDNGMDFGYQIEVKEIVENGSESKATIVITKINA